MLIAETTAIVCIAISELPIVHILNSLVSKGVQDRIEEENLNADFYEEMTQSIINSAMSKGTFENESEYQTEGSGSFQTS